MIGRKGHEERAPEDLRCSFCNKSQQDIRKLIAGPRVFICDECVAIAWTSFQMTGEWKQARRKRAHLRRQ